MSLLLSQSIIYSIQLLSAINNYFDIYPNFTTLESCAVTGGGHDKIEDGLIELSNMKQENLFHGLCIKINWNWWY